MVPGGLARREAVADGAAVTKMAIKAKSVEAPYPGARPFRQNDRGRFFGRTSDAPALAELWQANRLTLAIGRVASGKTSLLQAGVFPLVSETRADTLPIGRVCYGSTFPAAALPQHNPYSLALLRSWSPGDTATRLVGLSVHDFVRTRAELHDGVILAAIDQVDDLLAASGAHGAHRRQFFAELARALRSEPRLHLLLVARDETLDLISGALGNGARFRVRALTQQSAIEAVTKPTAGIGRSYADGAAERLVAELQTSRIRAEGGAERFVEGEDVEPSLLQAVCTRLWNALPPDVDLVTTRDIRLYGDVDTALAAHCSQVVATVADDHDLSVTRLRSWLLDTFVTELGTRGTTYEGPGLTSGMPNGVLRSLVDRHLLSAEWRSGSRWYELLSDRLIEPLRRALDERPSPVDPGEYLRKAEHALTVGDLELAGRYVDATLRTSADTDLRLRARVESFLGNLANEQGKVTDAEEHYRSAASLFETLRDTPEVARQLAAVGHTLLAQDDPEDAVSQLQAAVTRMPSDPILQTGLGLALWQLGDGPGAVAILTAVLAVDGGNPVALRARGEILAYLGDARAAARDLNRVALQEWPASRAALGLALAQLGDRADAEAQLDEALTEAQRNGAVLLYAAKAKKLLGDEIAAGDLARQAGDATDPALSPQHREMANKLAEYSEEFTAVESGHRRSSALPP